MYYTFPETINSYNQQENHQSQKDNQPGLERKAQHIDKKQFEPPSHISHTGNVDE